AGIVKAVLVMIERRKQLSGNAEGANGVPYAEEVDLGAKVTIRLIAVHEVSRRMRPRAPIIFPCQPEIAKLLAFQDATGIDETGQATGREGAARESKQKDFIAGEIVLRDKHVAGTDILIDAEAGGALESDFRLQACGADATQVENGLGNSAR